MGSSGRWQLVTFESARALARRTAIRKQQTNLWDALHLLAAATHEANMQEAFSQSLEAGQLLTGAGHLAVYRLIPHDPGLERYAVWGNPKAIPAHFKTIDMNILRGRALWTPSKHPASRLQRAARSASFKYLLSFPLGEPKALDGLLVLGDLENGPPQGIEQITRVLADAITTIFQKNILTINLQDRLHLQKTDLALSQAIQESVANGVIVLTTQLLIQELNQAAELTLSYATSEVKGTPVHNILIATDTLIPALKAAQEGIPTLNMGNLRLHRRNGSSFQAHVRITPVKVDGKVERIIVVFQDLSEHESLRLTTQQLEQRALLGEVTAIFAHEVRNPINNISSGLQLMSHQLPADDPHQDSVGRMMDDCTRLDHLTLWTTVNDWIT
jgi:PAS domain S-box-containing protein